MTRSGKPNGSIPSERRRDAARVAADALERRERLPLGAIPIDDDAWAHFVERLVWLTPAIAGIDRDVRRAAERGDFGSLRRAGESVAALLERVDETLRPAAMFVHTRRPELERLHVLIGSRCEHWTRQLIGEADARAGRLTDVDDALAALSGPERDPIDPWHAALGVPRSQIADPRGIVSLPLVLAAFHGRLDVLRQLVARLYRPFGVTSLEHLRAVDYTRTLLEAADPIEVAQTAIHVRRLIATQFAEDPEATAAAFCDLLEGVERSHSSIEMILENQKRIAETNRAHTRASLRLDNYRRMVESQVRPWAWVIVRLHTRASGSAPMLSQLLDRLRATHDSLAARFAECIEVEARNAAAHEDNRWDARRQALVGPNADIDVAMLTALTRRAQGLMSGAELGWALACGDLPELTELSHRQVSIPRPMILQMNAALSRFATNDLQVDEWSYDVDTLTVTIRDLPFRKFNPGAQAVLEASMELRDVERFEVRVRGHEQAALVATRATLARATSLWLTALADFTIMPSAVFLPLLVESRLEVEAPDVAARAAAWLALNEAVQCLDDVPWVLLSAGTAPREALRLPACELALTAAALSQAMTVTTGADETVVARAQRAIHGAAVYASQALAGPPDQTAESVHLLARLDGRIRNLWAALPACAPLPTVDREPLA
ncbi:hypothetical protein [Cellulomonas denverensis]|uniref:Uncharacterized protein n=1 Tax=Cellulomonas denverensis TaxID=264297 RepID=A0A7X6KVK6_9CELL|nr:hypothetical protein [Cellulomonas denverensis]NKY23116.1 hypothetical protein [Cellulomonas denverensis]GIG23802.1 hypothetical protein Cde04nite_00460 [Cellulomonas denverensis]